MVEYREAAEVSQAATAGLASQGFRGFSLWRAIVYGLALSGLAYAVETIQSASPYAQANVAGRLAVGPLLFLTIAAFSNLFSSRKIGPSVAALLIIAGIVLIVLAAVNGWFDKVTLQ
jgi:hypothetical protein